MGRPFQQALLIVVAGAVLGLAANSVSPRRIPFITPPKVAAPPSDYIPLAEAEQLWTSGAVFFLDARATDDYAAGHIANSFSLPIDQFDSHFPAVAPMLAPASDIVVYCDGEDCDLSHELKARLRQLGFERVRVLKNGWTVWRNAGLPITPGGQAR